MSSTHGSKSSTQGSTSSTQGSTSSTQGSKSSTQGSKSSTQGSTSSTHGMAVSMVPGAQESSTRVRHARMRVCHWTHAKDTRWPTVLASSALGLGEMHGLFVPQQHLRCSLRRPPGTLLVRPC
jgi:hypothetical protein